MTNEDRIELLEHRVRELQTAVAAIVRHLGIDHQVAEVERAQLDEIRLSGKPEVPRERLIELYSGPPAGQ
jgi:hypothetical protein